MFDHIAQGRRLKKDDQKPGNVPFIMAGTGNAGVVGLISNPVASFPANSLTVDIFGNTFYRDYAFGAGDDTGVYWNVSRVYSKGQMLFMGIAIERSLQGKFSFGKKLRSSQSYDFKISLPVTATGAIDFAFMDSFINGLEEERMRDLGAYLKVSGLEGCKLSASEHKALDCFGVIDWREYNVKCLFGDSTRGKRLKSDDRVPGTLPFVTAGEAEEGVSAFIGNKVDVFKKNTTTIDMFGSAKYRNCEYGADDHVAVVHTEKLPNHAAMFVTAACHKAAHTGAFDYGRNFYAKDANALNIMLPTLDSGLPDYGYMETFMRAVQKLVVKDVADFVAKRISVTKKCVKGGSRAIANQEALGGGGRGATALPEAATSAALPPVGMGYAREDGEGDYAMAATGERRYG